MSIGTTSGAGTAGVGAVKERGQVKRSLGTSGQTLNVKVVGNRGVG